MFAIIPILLVILLVNGCTFNDTKDIIQIKDITQMSYEERMEYCPELCGGLYSHDPCANDCMAGVESKNTVKRDFSSMTLEEVRSTCTVMCGDDTSSGDSCVDDCVSSHT